MTTPTRRNGGPVLVQEAVPEDLPEARALVAAAGLPLEGLADAASVVVARGGDAVVGTAALERHGAGPDTVFLLRSAAVAPTWRGRGVGSALIRAALERVDEAAAPVALLTETAEHWFPRFGFQPVDRTALPAALEASAELRGACPTSARTLLRPAAEAGRCGRGAVPCDDPGPPDTREERPWPTSSCSTTRRD
jgi:amino-acid N-acetyltransferase